MFCKLALVLAMIVPTSRGRSLHWSIDWLSQENFVSSSCLGKQSITCTKNPDVILKQRITALDQEIDTNFTILMTLSAVMSGILLTTLHTCYLKCSKHIDEAVPVVKPDVAWVPVIQSQQGNKEIEFRNMKATPTRNLIGCQYKDLV